ncbi:hypothetical protein REPUB_Repub11eG0027000 [Reevesia pubescens]
MATAFCLAAASNAVGTLIVEYTVKPVERRRRYLFRFNNVLKDVQSLEGRIEENKRCFRWCPNWIWRYRLSKEIEKKTEDITKLVNNSKFKRVRVGHRAELPGVEFMPSKGFVVSKSSTAAFNDIMAALKMIKST